MIRVAALAAAALLAGCGGGDEARPAPPVRDAPGAAVVQEWVDSIRSGDYPRAADLFALPAKIANGGRPRRVRTRAEVDVFNRTLPCGAVLIDAQEQEDGRLLAAFRLTNGPGGPCAGEARVLFLVRDGKIVEWVRANDRVPRDAVEA